MMRAAAVMALLAVASTGSAWVNEWHAIGPAGGQVNKIVVGATANTVFMIAGNGFYRSQDGGQTWQLVSNNFFNAPSGLALDPSDSQRVYVTAPNWPSVYVSTDGGATLSPAANLPTAVTQAQQVVVSHDGAALYVTSGSSVFCSTDRGQSWQPRAVLGTDSSAYAVKLVLDPSDPLSLYAVVHATATTYAYLATHDGATTWQTLRTGSASTDVDYDLAISPAAPQQLWEARDTGIWRSNDRGVSWANMLTTPMYTIAFDPTNSLVVYAGTAFGEILRSGDSGNTWAYTGGNVGAGQNVTIAVNPLQAATVMVGGSAGVAISTNSGGSWSVSNSGLNATAQATFSADTGADRIYINVPSGGIYVDAGGSGATIPVNNASLLQVAYPNLSLYISAMLATPGHLYASLATGLATSTDGGTTWSLSHPIPILAQQFFSMASPVGAPQTLLGTGSSSLYRTTDGGASWTQVTAGVPSDASFGSVCTAASDPTVVYSYLYAVSTAPTGGPTALLGLYRSTDTGATWIRVSSEQTLLTRLLAVDPTNASTLYRSSDTDFSKSIDGGRTWAPNPWDRNAASGYPSVLAVDPLHPQILYAGSSGLIARSVDAGATWETLRSTLNIGSLFAYSMLADPNRPESLLVGTYGSGVQQITIAPNLNLTSVAPTTAIAVGQAAALSFTAANRGPFDATGVRVSLQIPDTAQSVSATATNGSCTVAPGAVACVIPVLRSGTSAAITVNANPTSAGMFTSSGSVTGDQPDPDTTDNATTLAATAAIITDLSVAASGPATAEIGKAITYTVGVSNFGPSVSTASRLSYQLATGLTLGSVSSGSGSCSAIGNSVSCAFATLTMGASTSVSITATATTAGMQKSTATVSTSDVDPVASNNSAITSINVAAPPPVATSPPVTSSAPSTTPAGPPQRSQGGGGAIGLWELAALSLLIYQRRRIASSNVGV